MNPTSKNSPAVHPRFEIVSARIFEAPRDVVFDAFATPRHLAEWWGPKGFTNVFKEFDLRAEGAWRFIMRAPDGTEYDNVKRFLEVVQPERVVFEHLGPMHRFKMTMTYEDLGASTRLTWQMVFESAESESLKRFISEANEQNFDRLNASLKQNRQRGIQNTVGDA